MIKHKTRILLAEDDDALGGLLKERLEQKDYEVTWTRDGAEAMAAFQQNSFQLLVLDVMMPQKDGFTLAMEIRKSDKNVPIIFLTARSQKEDKLTGFKMGADDYITKSADMFEELLARIQALLRRTTEAQVPTSSTTLFKLGQYEFDLYCTLNQIQ